MRPNLVACEGFLHVPGVSVELHVLWSCGISSRQTQFWSFPKYFKALNKASDVNTKSSRDLNRKRDTESNSKRASIPYKLLGEKAQMY